MRTRDAPRGPRATAAEWAARLRELGCERYEQRIDSTLRGAPAEELAGLLEGAGLDAVVVAVPAWPDARPRVRRRLPARRRAGRSTWRRRCSAAGAEVVRPEELAGRVRGGATRIVVDGESDADLLAAARAVDALDGARGHGVAGRLAAVPPARGARRHRLRARRARLQHRRSTTASWTRCAPRATSSCRWRGPARRPAAGTTVTPRGAGPSCVGDASTDSRPRRRPPRPAPRRPRRRRRGRAAGRGARARAALPRRSWPAAGTWPRGSSTRSARSGSPWTGRSPRCARAVRVAGGAWSGLAVITKGGLVGSRRHPSHPRGRPLEGLETWTAPRSR